MSVDVTSISQYITDPPIALLLISYALAILGAAKGWWVPKFLYDKLEERNDKLEAAVTNVTAALKDLITEIRERK